jgi:hypothetical protein
LLGDPEGVDTTRLDGGVREQDSQPNIGFNKAFIIGLTHFVDVVGAMHPQHQRI